MNKLYKWGGFAIVAMTPLTVIACSSTDAKKTFEDYLQTSNVTTSAANVPFKGLDKFIGKTLAVQVKKVGDTSWSYTMREGISESNKDSVIVSFTDLQAGSTYTVKAFILKPGTTQIIETLGEKSSAFKTLSDATSTPTPTPTPDPTPGDTPETPEVPELKEITTNTEVVSPSNVRVNILDAQKYIGKKLILKYKQNKKTTDLKVENYFYLSDSTSNQATLNFNGELLAAYVGKKLKIEYKKTSAPTSGDSTPTTPVWLSKISNISAEVPTKKLSILVEGLEVSKYDVKLSIIGEDNSTLIQNLGEKNEAFEVKADAVSMPAPAKYKTMEMLVTSENAPKLVYSLTDLELSAEYKYSVEMSAEDVTAPNVTILPFNEANLFNTSSLAKITKSMVGGKVSLKVEKLLEKYNNETLVVSLVKTSTASKEEILPKSVVVVSRTIELTYLNLEASSNYKIQISLSKNGELIKLEGLNETDLTLATPAAPALSLKATEGPTSIIVNGSGLLAYSGQNLVIKYAPKDVTATPQEALVSEYAAQSTGTISESGTFSLPMLNLTKLNSKEDKNVDRTYVYQILLEGTQLSIFADGQPKEAKTTKFANVKLSIAVDKDSTIKYAGSSAKVLIKDVEAFKGKELVIRAIPNPNTNIEYLANYFPKDETTIRKSEPVMIAETTTEQEFKILNLDSQIWYVFQVFVKDEQNPLLIKGYDFQSNVSPKTDEILSAKNAVKIKVSRLANSIGGKIKLKWASTIAKLDSTTAGDYTTVDEQTISNDNKDSIEFSLSSISGTSFAYRLEIQPVGETEFSEAKEVFVQLPTSEAKGTLGGMTVVLKNAKILEGKTVMIKYRKASETTGAFIDGKTETSVSVDGLATITEIGLDAGEVYDYQFWTKETAAFEILNSEADTKKVQVLSEPIAEVVYSTDKTQILIKIQNLYSFATHSIKMQSRKAVAAGTKANDWLDVPEKQVVEANKEAEGVAFSIASLEASQKYEFQVINETTNKIIVSTTSFQYPTT